MSHLKTLFISITLLLSLLIVGCSSTAPDAVIDQEVESRGTPSSAPSAMEDRLYKKADEESMEKEEAEKLKKRKSSDDDMERLD